MLTTYLKKKKKLKSIACDLFLCALYHYYFILLLKAILFNLKILLLHVFVFIFDYSFELIFTILNR